MKPASRRLVFFTTAIFLLFCGISSAQQSQPENPPAPQPQSQSGTASTPDKPNDQSKSTETDPKAVSTTVQVDKNAATQTTDKNAGTSNDRLFFTLPNFLTLENAGQVPPLTAGQKFRVVARGNFDYIQYVWYGFLSGISQAEDSEPGYGQGAEGYAKRYGAAFADGTIENFMTGAILPTILHQDPRYFQLGHGSFIHRTWYAASRNIITRTDSGHKQFNYSEVLGGGISAAISTYSYHPTADKTFTNTLSVWATQYGYDTLTLGVKEFWPDIRRKILHKHPVEPSPAANPPQ